VEFDPISRTRDCPLASMVRPLERLEASRKRPLTLLGTVSWPMAPSVMVSPLRLEAKRIILLGDAVAVPRNSRRSASLAASKISPVLTAPMVRGPGRVKPRRVRQWVHGLGGASVVAEGGELEVCGKGDVGVC